MSSYGLRYPGTGGSGGSDVIFPDTPPAVPSAYDEEGDQTSLAAKWTTVATPDASYVLDTDQRGSLIGMQGPGHATNVWHIRQAIPDAVGNYPAALTVTAKFIVSSQAGNPALLVQLNDNVALNGGNYIHPALVGGVGAVGQATTNNQGVVVNTAMPSMARTLFVHYQRNTAATNNVRLFFSLDGLSWVRLLVATKTTNVDYLHLYFQGGVAAQPTGMWCDWLRVNDPRFLQPE